MVRSLLLAAAVILYFGSSIQAQGEHRVKSYYRQDGTYVNAHYRTNRDDLVNNNWSTEGNVNPYTGQPGWIPPVLDEESLAIYQKRVSELFPLGYDGYPITSPENSPLQPPLEFTGVLSDRQTSAVYNMMLSSALKQANEMLADLDTTVTESVWEGRRWNLGEVVYHKSEKYKSDYDEFLKYAEWIKPEYRPAILVEVMRTLPKPYKHPDIQNGIYIKVD